MHCTSRHCRRLCSQVFLQDWSYWEEHDFQLLALNAFPCQCGFHFQKKPNGPSLMNRVFFFILAACPCEILLGFVIERGVLT